MNKLTVSVIGAAAAILIGYDVYALMAGGTEASISYTIIAWSYKYPILTFASGFLMGHLFWRVRDVGLSKYWGKSPEGEGK